MTKKKLLVIEDERNISEIIITNARIAGYECDTAFDGPYGYKMVCENKYDLILLDIMLPGMDGFEVCRRLRHDGISTPVIMVTAREEETDKVLGLELGADDYITKPFGLKELMARIKANIRRSSNEPVISPQTGEVVSAGGLIIDGEKYQVRKNGQAIELTKKEYDLLLYFSKNPNRIITREELLERVWGYGGYLGDQRSVDVSIHRLRIKIEDDPSNPQIIQNKRGVGYFLAL